MLLYSNSDCVHLLCKLAYQLQYWLYINIVHVKKTWMGENSKYFIVICFKYQDYHCHIKLFWATWNHWKMFPSNFEITEEALKMKGISLVVFIIMIMIMIMIILLLCVGSNTSCHPFVWYFLLLPLCCYFDRYWLFFAFFFLFLFKPFWKDSFI